MLCLVGKSTKLNGTNKDRFFPLNLLSPCYCGYSFWSSQISTVSLFPSLSSLSLSLSRKLSHAAPAQLGLMKAGRGPGRELSPTDEGRSATQKVAPLHRRQFCIVPGKPYTFGAISQHHFCCYFEQIDQIQH